MKESTVLEQICQMIGIERLAERGRETGANRYSKGLTVERLLLVLAAAQIRRAESLRDTAQLCSEDKALREVVGLDALRRSTLSDALVRFDAGLFENLFREAADKFAHRLRKERGKALRDILTLVDSTTITLPLSSHAWASYQHALGAVKAHMALEQAGDAIYPTQIILTNGKIADISIAKTRLTPRPDSILVADRGYEDKHLFRMNALQGMRFVIRAKNSTYYYPVGDVPHALSQGTISDEYVVTRIEDLSRRGVPRLRKIVLPPFDGHERPITIITNLLDRTAAEIGEMYRKRWRIEIFFRFLKTRLHITKLYGTSENAIRIQIAVCGLVALAIAYLSMLAEQALASIGGPTVCLRRLRYCLLSAYNLAELLLRPLHTKKRALSSSIPPLIPPIQLTLPLVFA